MRASVLALGLCLPLILAACDRPDGVWELEKAGGKPIDIGDQRITFSHGAFAATGCNGLAGRYRTAGNRIWFEPRDHAARTCPGLKGAQGMRHEAAVEAHMRKGYAFQPLSDGQMLLTAGDGTTLLLRPATPR